MFLVLNRAWNAVELSLTRPEEREHGIFSVLIPAFENHCTAMRIRLAGIIRKIEEGKGLE